MDKRTADAERKLRDYPLSLRESARAVFGDSYARAERSAPEAVGSNPIRSRS